MEQTLRVNFVMPGYSPFPNGGFRVVFEYANFLAKRGHAVTFLFPRYLPQPRTTPVAAVKRRLELLKRHLLDRRPIIPWHTFHPKVRFAFVPGVRDKFIPDADVIVATFWTTATPVANLAQSKGKKFYLIQGHETWAGPADQVNATWRLPLRKIVISRWLEDIGQKIGATDMRHIPNGIDLKRFRITTPPDRRPIHILSLYHQSAFKGVSDALAVMRTYHQRFPGIPVSMFGAARRTKEIPEWITYLSNPPQDALVNFYNQGTVYLGASLSEGWALPPAEAMACGCGFVGTDIGGFRDYAIHNDTALLSPPHDRDAMLRNLIAVTEDSKLLRRLQKRGTEYIQQFTWERAGTALEQYFLE